MGLWVAVAVIVMFFFNVCVFSLGSWLRKRKEKGTKAGKTAKLTVGKESYTRARRMYRMYRPYSMYVVLKKLYATNFKLKLEKNTLDLNADKVTKQWAKLSVALSLITLNMVNLELACLSLPTNEITEGEYSKISKLSPRKDKYRTKLPSKVLKIYTKFHESINF